MNALTSSSVNAVLSIFNNFQTKRESNHVLRR